jgi:mRNA-degrading endonuclease RelE of RelBE toxin-antitoxin system
VIYSILFSHNADAYFFRLDRATQERIDQLLFDIAGDPYNPAYSKPLTGLAGRRSARFGAYRIVLSVNTEAVRIEVSDIGPRGRVYRDL